MKPLSEGQGVPQAGKVDNSVELAMEDQYYLFYTKTQKVKNK
jgi:hypothetical protein